MSFALGSGPFRQKQADSSCFLPRKHLFCVCCSNLLRLPGEFGEHQKNHEHLLLFRLPFATRRLVNEIRNYCRHLEWPSIVCPLAVILINMSVSSVGCGSRLGSISPLLRTAKFKAEKLVLVVDARVPSPTRAPLGTRSRWSKLFSELALPPHNRSASHF